MRRRNTRSASRFLHPHHHPLGKNLIRKNQRSLNSRLKNKNRKSIFLNWTQHQYQNRNQTSTSWQVSRHSPPNRLKHLCLTSCRPHPLCSSSNNNSPSSSRSLNRPNPSQLSTSCSSLPNPPSSLAKRTKPKLCNVNSRLNPRQLSRKQPM